MGFEPGENLYWDLKEALKAKIKEVNESVHDKYTQDEVVKILEEIDNVA